MKEKCGIFSEFPMKIATKKTLKNIIAIVFYPHQRNQGILFELAMQLRILNFDQETYDLVDPQNNAGSHLQSGNVQSENMKNIA